MKESRYKQLMDFVPATTDSHSILRNIRIMRLFPKLNQAALVRRRTVTKRTFTFAPNLGFVEPLENPDIGGNWSRFESLSEVGDGGGVEPSVIEPTIPDFHELSSSGYNGRLAAAYQSSNRSQKILGLAESMRALGERPSGALSYNYILSALLEAGRRKDAFALLREMESRKLSPDIFTFELLLRDLSQNEAMAVTVDELFHLMQIRYGLEPSAQCWHARLQAWMSRFNENRVIQLLGEFRAKGKIRFDGEMYYSLLRLALHRNLWSVFGHIMDLASSTPANSQTLLTTKHYYGLWLARHTRLVPRMVPHLRSIFKKLDRAVLDEGSYARLLYFATRMGNSIADLAFLALSKLSTLYAHDGTLALPRIYLEAYVECINTETSEEYFRPPSSIESKMIVKHVELAQKIQSILSTTTSDNDKMGL